MSDGKRGRPLGKKYPVEYRIRMTNDQWDILNNQADKKGITIAEYLRGIITNELESIYKDSVKSVIDEALAEVRDDGPKESE